MSSLLRSLLVGLGVAGGVVPVLVAPLLGACFCDPGTPETERCGSPLTDFSGVTEVTLVNARGVRGFQGGSHFQFQISARGTGLGRCFAQSSVLTSPSGTVLATSSDSVAASVDATGATVTSPVFVFPLEFPPTGHLRVETLGRVLEADVPIDPFAPPDAAVVLPDAGTDVGVDTNPPDAPAAPVSVTLTIQDQAGRPVVGAYVYVDLPETGRSVSAMTDDTGRVTSPELVWPEGSSITVSVIHDETLPLSILGVTRPAVEMLGPVVVTRRAVGVVASGNVTLTDPGHRLWMGADAWEGATSVAVGGAWSLTVPPGAPFRLFAFEYAETGGPTRNLFGAAVLESAALEADATIDVTLAAPAPVTRVTGTVVLPAAMGLYDADLVEVLVENLDTGAHAQGLLTRVTRAPSATTADYEMAYLEHASNVRPATTFVLAGPGPIEVRRTMPGLPSGGYLSAGWPEPPFSSASDATVTSGDRVAFEFREGIVRVLLSDSEPRWQLLVLTPGDHVIPTRYADPSAWTFPLTARLEACTPLSGIGGPCTSMVTGRPFSYDR